MVRPTEAFSNQLLPKDRIIVALDVETSDEARMITRELSGRVGAFKVGMQLFTSEGPAIVRELTQLGHKIFLDLKFHDIPNTVAKAAVEAARLGVWMFNVHASGGGTMMRRTAEEVGEACERYAIERPLMIAVTVLTSSDDETLMEIGIRSGAVDQAVSLAYLAFASGMDGVVASPNEVKMIRESVVDPDFLTVTPGIRSKHATHDDQKRVTTFSQAMANGSDYVVVGRPITQASDRAAAVESLLSEL